MNLAAIRQRILWLIKSARGHNLLTFLVFVLIASFFWVLTALNDEVQRNYELPVDIVNVPSGTTVLNMDPLTVNVSVKNKGLSLLRFAFGYRPKINIRFNDYRNPKQNRVIVSEQALMGILRQTFGESADVVSVRPDSISVNYTNLPGQRMPLIVDIDAMCDPQYIIYGKYMLATDSVTVYSVEGLPSKVVAINSQRVSLRGLTDTATVEVPVLAPAGTKVEPASVQVKVPVEPLIQVEKVIDIKHVGVPSGHTMMMFPKAVKVSFLLPMSIYNKDYVNPVVTADYRKADHATAKVPLEISQRPDYCRSPKLETSIVDYIIEQK